MGAPDLLQHLRGAGFDLAVTAEGGLMVTPASRLSPDQTAAIRAHRDDLVAALSADALACAITEACRLRGDDAANRDALIAEATALDADTQADLIEHFNSVAAMWRRIFSTDRGLQHDPTHTTR